MPSTGRLDYLLFQDEGRVETGVEEGDAISPFYDPMVAKLVAWGPDRDTAIQLLGQMAGSVEIHPVRTNAGFLFRVLENDDFREALLDTGFIAEHLDSLLPPEWPEELAWGTAATFALQRARDEDEGLAGFRLNAPSRMSVALAHAGETRTLTDDLILANATGYMEDDRILVFDRGTTFEFMKATRGTGSHSSHDGDILAPMPGKVIAVDVAEGDAVTAGQRLLVLEAMKMEHALTAPFDGTVTGLSVSAGSQVQVEALLAVVEPATGSAD